MAQRRSIHDPKVLFAMRKRFERQAERRNYRAVKAALEREGQAALAELMELTGLDRTDCGRALDRLVIGRLAEVADGLYAAVGTAQELQK